MKNERDEEWFELTTRTMDVAMRTEPQRPREWIFDKAVPLDEVQRVRAHYNGQRDPFGGRWCVMHPAPLADGGHMLLFQ